MVYFPVSKEHRLPASYPTDTSIFDLSSVEGKDGPLPIASFAAGPLENMLDDARKAGFEPYLVSGFRSINDQHDVFNAYVDKEVEATGGAKTNDEAAQDVNAYSSKPGYSEHHLGTAADILVYPEDDSDVWQYAETHYNDGFYGWLRQNAYKYGFVISYPTGKTVTEAKKGSGYPAAEPWHVRYVGKDVAVKLMDGKYLDPLSSVTVDSFLKDYYKN
jgi:D-alanyl-D-alanine carboxypeptidase